ncbi:MAG: DUF535 family protein [Proteobacteria bacterium]|nr:DUF535 family protein [Pseudomonadota bacterium]
MNRTLFYTKKIAALYGYEKAAYFFLYAHTHRKILNRWFDDLDTKLPSCTSEATRVRLAMRPVYRYVRPGLSPTQKIDIINYYYTSLATRFSPAGVTSFLHEEGHQMAELTGKSGRKYALILLTETTKEGAIKFLLMDTHLNACLAKITGIIGVDKNQHPVFLVGSIQGSYPPTGKEDIAHATKDLNNLRPKQVVFYAACALAEWFGIDTVLAPSLRNQIAMKVFYRKHKIYNDYNSFWEEFVPISPDNDYHIPLPVPRRQAADVPSKRRKDWLLRYERIDSLSASIKERLSSFQ